MIIRSINGIAANYGSLGLLISLRNWLACKPKLSTTFRAGAVDAITARGAFDEWKECRVHAIEY